MKILLVEGKNDAEVVKALCDKEHIATEIQQEIESYDQKNAFVIYLPKNSSDKEALKRINQVGKIEGIEVIGIILDTDKPEDNPNVNSRVEAIKYQLNKLISPPASQLRKLPLSENGTVCDNIGGLKKFGFWLMPDNKNPGMLEDFLMSIVQKPEECIEFAESCVKGAKERNCHSFQETHYSKAIIHTYLAWQNEPGNTLGVSIKSGKLNSEKEIAQKFMAWLRHLFSI